MLRAGGTGRFLRGIILNEIYGAQLFTIHLIRQALCQFKTQAAPGRKYKLTFLNYCLTLPLPGSRPLLPAAAPEPGYEPHHSLNRVC